MPHFHLNPETGDPQRCGNSECPHEPKFETPETVRAYYERLMAKYTWPTPKRKKSVPRIRRNVPTVLKKRSSQSAATQTGYSDLSNAFAQFKETDEAKVPPIDRGDWRETIARNAELNGDAWSDRNPDTSLTNAIYDPTGDEDSEE